MIVVKNIEKSFGNETVLRDVSACFNEGQTNLIIGKSGSGKTVLLKCIVGLHKPDSGRVLYGKEDFLNADFKLRKRIRQEIGMVFQGGALFTSETIQDNIMLPLNMFTTKTKKEKQLRVNECLDRVGISGTNDLFPGEISGGMQKRAAIARAIVLNPKYLFCDEPNSGLDPQTSILIDDLIFEITKEYNITTVINTHDMNSVMQIGEKIVFLSEGKLEWEGSKDMVLSAENQKLNQFVFASSLYKELIDKKK
jgi:phospholipid/cholesterol/gamma-HCH transport system ATP-binding protein